MNREEMVKVLRRKSSSKGELREALAAALGEGCPEWGKASGTVFSRCKAVFVRTYEGHTGLDYSWQVKDAGCLNSIVRKLYGIAKQTDDDHIVAAFEYMMDKLPKWYIEHALSVCVLNAKFNEIIAEIRKNGIGKKGNISDQYKRRILDDLQT